MTYFIILALAAFVVEANIASRISIDGVKLEKSKELESLEPVILQVFKNQNEGLSPEQTLEILNNLKVEFSKLDPMIYAGVVKKLADLVQLSRSNVDKCRLKYLRGFKELVSDKSKHSFNIMTYLEHSLTKQLKTCGDELARALWEHIGAMPANEKQVVETLRDNVLVWASDRNLKSLLPLPELTKGIFQYLEKSLTFRALLSDRESKKVFNKEVELRVFKVCSDLRSKLSPTARIYDLFLYDTNYIKREDLHNFSEHWLVNLRICQIITSNKDYLSKHLCQEVRHKYQEAKNDFCPFNCLRNKI